MPPDPELRNENLGSSLTVNSVESKNTNLSIEDHSTAASSARSTPAKVPDSSLQKVVETQENNGICGPSNDTTQLKSEQEDEDPTQAVLGSDHADSSSGSDSDNNRVLFHRSLKSRVRRKSLQTRRKKASRQLRGYGEYMRLMEDRISFLENQIGMEEIPKTAPPPKGVTRPPPAVPNVKYMSWEEYLIAKGQATPASHFAIDVLIEKPVLMPQSNRSKTLSSQGVNVASKAFPLPDVSSLSRETTNGLKDLPERIRINSRPVKGILDSFCDRALPFPTHGPIVFQAPYKFLVHHENVSREYMEELKKKWGAPAKSVARQSLPTFDGDDAMLPKYTPPESLPCEAEDTSIIFNTSRDETEPNAPPAGQKIATSRPTSASRGSTHLPDFDEAEHLPARWEKCYDICGRIYYQDHNTRSTAWATPENSRVETETTDIDDMLCTSIGALPPLIRRLIRSEEALNDLNCLIGFMDEFLVPLRDQVQKCRRSEVRFSELWYVFKPGQLIYMKDKEIPQKVWRVLQVTGGRKFLKPPPEDRARERKAAEFSDFVLDCYYLEYDGSIWGVIYKQFHIEKYEDSRAIDSLPLYPFTAGKPGCDEAALMNQGQEYIRCTKIYHRYYSGRSLVKKSDGSQLFHLSENDGGRPQKLAPETIESEVIIDFDRAFQHHPDWSPSLNGQSGYVMDSSECSELEHDDNLKEMMENDFKWDTRRTDEFIKGDDLKIQPWSKGFEPRDDDILLLPDRVFGFVLRGRKWACLKLGNDTHGVEALRPVKMKTDGWNDLELPDGHKEIVQSLIDSHFTQNKDASIDFDLTKGKGKGLIILLHGAPGVGKTSTAECVAQTNNRPLLPITCGDLGLKAREVESKLEYNFQLAQAWNCVLLLDEADIFLAARTNTSLERNALVSVFLRVLEYYEGILFLTTNRVGSVDEAFKSRIHMALFYPSLDLAKTKQIWRSHIRKIKSRQDKKIEIQEEKILDYAQRLFDTPQPHNSKGLRWNGRQIRNAFQSALAIAEYQSKEAHSARLEVSHFEKVARASSQFDEYLWKVHRGRNDDDRAYHNMLRDDGFDVTAASLDSVQLPMTPQRETRTDPSFRRSQTPLSHSSNTQYAPSQYPPPQYTQPQYTQAQYLQTPPHQQVYQTNSIPPTPFQQPPVVQNYPPPPNNVQNFDPQKPFASQYQQQYPQPTAGQQPGYSMQQTDVLVSQTDTSIQQSSPQPPPQQQAGAPMPPHSFAPLQQGVPTQQVQNQQGGQQNWINR